MLFRSSVLPVIRGFANTWNALQRLKQKNRTHAPVLQFLGATQNELQRLVPVNFPELYPDERLSEIPRYLKALSIRAERGSLNLAATDSKLKEIGFYLEKLQAIQNCITPSTSLEKQNKTNDFFWMIEEYKVSLFAQELKTPCPVSPKRLDQLIDEIASIIS